jgi:putative copper export protein
MGSLYNIIVPLHIICAGIWISTIIAAPLAKKRITSDNDTNQKSLILCFLKYTNIVGIIGSIGLLITGVLMVLMNDAYGFFKFSSDHWLVTKQIIMLIILGMVFLQVIPAAKKVRAALESEGKEEILAKVGKLNSTSQIVIILVVINILLAFSKNFM